MIKRVVMACVAFSIFYAGLIQLQVFLAGRAGPKVAGAKTEAESPSHKVYSFSFAKYTSGGEKEIEIEGDSADILAEKVNLTDVMAKAFAEETPVTMTSDLGNYNKTLGTIHLQKNVVATTEDGTRLLTESLDIHPANRTMKTEVRAEVKKDNINVEGIGAEGDSNLKNVEFLKKVTVIIQDPENPKVGSTVITCDGPLLVDYGKNIAHFKTNVVATDSRGKLSADFMDVYYNRVTRKVAKIVALGGTVIENPDGNKTFSDSAIYLADEGRVILGGDTEGIYYEGTQMDRRIL